MIRLGKMMLFGLGSTAFVILVLWMFANTELSKEGLNSITTYVEKQIRTDDELNIPKVKIILAEADSNDTALSDDDFVSNNALFDIRLSIPKISREITMGENLLVSIDLINFGDPGKISTSISYIITNSNGDIILIEHEKKVVETQTSHIKVIDLPDLSSGNYKLFVEVIYFNASAIAVEEFKVI